MTYVIITHSPSLQNAAEPSHVSAVLVDKDCRHVDSIDLTYNVATQAQQTVGAEKTEDRRDVQLRKGVAAKRKGSAS